MTLKLCVAQLNFIVGQVPSNAEKIERAAKEAKAQGAGLVIFPELSLLGYPPKDLLFDNSLIAKNEEHR